ncbi:MAG: UDP-N-acetylmuramoyl-tripeptide--D-alanyl-D-alanine ligase [Syntrophaceae bacterium]|nr:UDP-N-acetylmuramoyl-tripeptide--D-alanyl-D-alanine ligase [Syntrophaceae bacterium]
MTEIGAPSLTIGEILRATGGALLQGHSDDSICGISTDTRTLKPGNLFIPLAGPNFNGHNFLVKAVADGARAFLSAKSHRGNVPDFPADIARIEVIDTLQALGEIAHAWRQHFHCRVIAITGSAGKTTTKEMLAAICAPGHHILKTEGNFNNLIGLPQTLFGLKDDTDLAILELGTNAPGEIERLAYLAAPDIGVITNIGPAHLEGLGSVDAVREEKSSLWRVMDNQGTAVVNLDDPQIMILRERWEGEQITCSLTGPADVTAEAIRPMAAGKCAFTLNIRNDKKEIVLASPGRHNVGNALLAAAAAVAAGFNSTEIARGLHTFRPVSGRMEIETLPNGAHLIHDAYNANPLSVGEALKTLAELSGRGRRIVVFGDMLELGDQAAVYHEEIGRKIGESQIYALFLKGDFSRVMAGAAQAAGLDKNHIFFFDGKAKAIPALRENVTKGDWILLKGSRKMNLEELIPEIRKFGKGSTADD